MNYFDTWIDDLIRLEGGLVDHPKDPGGITKYGISLAAYPKLGRDGIKALTTDEASLIYYADYWSPGYCAVLDKELSFVHFSTCVHSGVSKGKQLLQELCGVAADGIMGKVTLTALSAIQKSTPSAVLAERYLDLRIDFLRTLKTWRTFGVGWTNRLNAELELIGLKAKYNNKRTGD